MMRVITAQNPSAGSSSTTPEIALLRQTLRRFVQV